MRLIFCPLPLTITGMVHMVRLRASSFQRFANRFHLVIPGAKPMEVVCGVIAARLDVVAVGTWVRTA